MGFEGKGAFYCSNSPNVFFSADVLSALRKAEEEINRLKFTSHEHIEKVIDDYLANSYEGIGEWENMEDYDRFQRCLLELKRRLMEEK